MTRVVLATAHLNHDPALSRQRNLRAWCQRCHLTHDRSWHLLQRWLTYRLRYARADLFLGPYRHGPSAATRFPEILAHISDRLARERAEEPRSSPRPLTWPRAQLLLGEGRGQRRIIGKQAVVI
jgi:hypothetical protein